MRMRELTSGLEIPANGEVALSPGGYHMMFTGLKQPLEKGDERQGVPDLRTCRNGRRRIRGRRRRRRRARRRRQAGRFHEGHENVSVGVRESRKNRSRCPQRSSSAAWRILPRRCCCSARAPSSGRWLRRAWRANWRRPVATDGRRRDRRRRCRRFSPGSRSKRGRWATAGAIPSIPILCAPSLSKPPSARSGCGESRLALVLVGALWRRPPRSLGVRRPRLRNAAGEPRPCRPCGYAGRGRSARCTASIMPFICFARGPGSARCRRWFFALGDAAIQSALR